VCCRDDGVPSFDRIRHDRYDARVFLYASDLIELNGNDMRREPFETRKATLASLLKRAAPGLRRNEHIKADGPTVFAHGCKWASKASSRSARLPPIAPAVGSRARG